MSDNELLLAISDMMDKKLKPIHTDIRELQKDMSEVKTDVAELKTDVRELQEDMSKVKADILDLQVTVGNMQINMKKMQIQMEMDFSPRLQNIESCYLSTYQRYSKGTEQIDSMQMDIDVLKSTVIEHSEKLQRIS